MPFDISAWSVAFKGPQQLRVAVITEIRWQERPVPYESVKLIQL